MNKILIALNILSIVVALILFAIVVQLFFNGEQLLVDYEGKVIRYFSGVIVEGLFFYSNFVWISLLPISIVNFIRSRKEKFTGVISLLVNLACIVLIVSFAISVSLKGILILN